MNPEPKTPKKRGCKNCPQAQPASTASDAAQPTPEAAVPQIMWEVEVKVERVKIGSLMCYHGAKLRFPEARADELVAAGMVTKLQPVF